MHRWGPLSSLLAAGLFLAVTADAPAAEPRAWWVFLADKGVAPALADDLARSRAADLLSARALERRRKARGDAPVDALDLPLRADHVRRVLATGARERHRLRWFNAVTVDATDEQVRAIRALPFVARVKPVVRQVHRYGEPDPADARPRGPEGAVPRGGPVYGECASQLVPIQVDQLHALGLSGAGVRVAVFDTGFLRTHVAFASTNVVAEHDFLQDDGNTANEPGDPSGQHNHGTYVLSLIGGHDPGNLVGPAHGAEFVLAKTEDVASETPAEEDHWAAAAQWADSLGADVISSSLAYYDWYTYEDLDGDTATITIAADLAAANGIVVFNSAGNEGLSPWFHVGTPADGDSVIAVGAVDSTGTVVGFSSHGPTADGRIKPDVCAMGEGTLVALTFDDVSYARGNGTSFSCPIAAGVGALLLEAHPEWGPWEVREALRSTASQAGAPDNDAGWGAIRAFDAYGHATSASLATVRTGRAIRAYPNPSVGATTLAWSLPRHEAIRSLEIVDAAGRRVRTVSAPGGGGGGHEGAVSWDGRDDGARPVPGGVYFARLVTATAVHSCRVVRIR
ncbi:MAG TPA: S8 family serine peptidase [bacterium]|nr:S8 family serine peptidase [bacterium]